MGWTGALAGLGKGMMDYATIMGEQRKNDWIVQRDFAMNQRNLELEELRNKNNLRVADKNNEYALERDKQNFGQLKEENDVRFKQGITQREQEFGQQLEKQNVQFNQQLAKQQAVQAANNLQELNLLEKKNTLTLENMDKVAQKTLDLKIKEKDQIYKALEGKLPEGTPEDVKNNLQLAVYSPELVSIINSSQRASAEEKKAMMNNVVDSYQNGMKSWAELPEKQQEDWDKKAKKAGEPSGQIAYAHMYAANTPGIKNFLGDDSGAKKTIPIDLQGKQLQQDILTKKDGLTLEEAKMKIPLGHPLRKYVDSLDTTGRLNRPNTMMENAGEVWNSSVAEPAVRAGSAIWKFGGRNVENDGLIRTNTIR